MKNIIRLHDTSTLWKEPEFFPESPFKFPFTRLKVLQIGVQVNLHRPLLCALKDLDKLEKLVLTTVKILHKYPVACLSLPSLKVLSINDLDLEKRFKLMIAGKKPAKKLLVLKYTKLIVKAKIETLFCSSLHLIKLIYPEYLTHLEADSDLANIDLSSFKNLRTLKYLALPKSNRNILEGLEHLEEVHLLNSNAPNELAGSLIDHLMNRRVALGRPNVQIFFHKIPLTKPFKEYGFPSDYTGEERMQISHYRDLPNRVDEKVCQYNWLIRALDGQASNLRMNGISLNEHGFPTCFFEKFPNIREIVQRCVSSETPFDEARFIWFVKQCRNVYRIRFHVDLCPSQYILDQLPDACGSLQALVFLHHFGETGEERRSEPNYAPLRRLKNLWGLEFSTQHLSEQLVEQLMGMIEDLQYLVQVTLHIVGNGRKKLVISKVARLYELYIGDFKRGFYDPRDSYPQKSLTRDALAELLTNQNER